MLPAALTAQVLLRRSPIRIFFLASAVAFSLQSRVEAYQAQRPQVSDVPQLTVIASKSIIVNTAEPIERVAVTTTDIADALVISPQQVMINGVHIVPGLLPEDRDFPLFTYVLTVGTAAEHRSRFIKRFLDGDRKPTEYLQRMDAVRQLDEYIVTQCRRHGVTVIQSSTFEQTVLALMDAAGADIEQRFDTHPKLRG